MIEVKRIDDHGLKVSIRLNGRSTQYFTELAAIKLRDKLIAVLSPIPPAPDLPALLKRCKPWLDVMRKEYSMRTTREITELDALLSDIEKMEAEK
jgi:hypothetical protein